MIKHIIKLGFIACLILANNPLFARSGFATVNECPNRQHLTLETILKLLSQLDATNGFKGCEFSLQQDAHANYKARIGVPGDGIAEVSLGALPLPQPSSILECSNDGKTNVISYTITNESSFTNISLGVLNGEIQHLSMQETDQAGIILNGAECQR